MLIYPRKNCSFVTSLKQSIMKEQKTYVVIYSHSGDDYKTYQIFQVYASTISQANKVARYVFPVSDKTHVIHGIMEYNAYHAVLLYNNP